VDITTPIRRILCIHELQECWPSMAVLEQLDLDWKASTVGGCCLPHAILCRRARGIHAGR
jgi:hypothetical protein